MFLYGAMVRSKNNIYLLIILQSYVQINNAGTNKGFRPLVTFSDDDITQVCLLLYSVAFHYDVACIIDQQTWCNHDILFPSFNLF